MGSRRGKPAAPCTQALSGDRTSRTRCLLRQDSMGTPRRGSHVSLPKAGRCPHPRMLSLSGHPLPPAVGRGQPDSFGPVRHKQK